MPSLTRRDLLKTGGALGAVAALAAGGRYAVLAPPPTGRDRTRSELAVAICDGIDARMRPHMCLAYDHPLRQYYNRGVWFGGAPVHAGNLSWESRRALTDLLELNLSASGRENLLSQFPSLLSGVNFLSLLTFGDPRSGPFQLILSGIHMNLRLGAMDATGVVFGGPQVYGDQRGDSRVGLPGNRFRNQMLAAQALRESLTEAQRGAVRQAQAPPQTRIGLQGAAGHFDGIPVGDLPVAAREQAGNVVESILASYSEDEAEQARQCLRSNGGIDALRFADYDEDYQGGRNARGGPSQIFRLEGPAAVFYFRGEPHVHAFIHVARDGDAVPGSGEKLGENPQTLESDALRSWFEQAMVEEGAADFARYPGWSLVGRLRAGPVHTSDIWTAESWDDELVICELPGKDIAPALLAAMNSRGMAPESDKRYRIAVTGYFAAADASDRIGRLRSRRSGGRLRDAFVAHARRRGFRVAV